MPSAYSATTVRWPSQTMSTAASFLISITRIASASVRPRGTVWRSALRVSLSIA